MEDKIIIPILRIEDAVSAAKRRESYSLKRDIQAREFNEAITARLEKEKSNDNEKEE